MDPGAGHRRQSTGRGVGVGWAEPPVPGVRPRHAGRFSTRSGRWSCRRSPEPGLKLKIVEAMLAGVPTVSTTVGAEGIDTSATGGLVVTDDPEHFARSLLTLHEDPRAWAEEREQGGGVLHRP